MSQPRQTIIFGKVAVDQGQNKHLTELFAHPGFALLKQIVGAHASEHQVKALNAALYTNFSEEARLDTQASTHTAIEYSRALDILEEISVKQEEWFTAKLETRP